MAKYGYTLVQHSGFGYSDKPGFEQAVEIRSVDSVLDRNKVERARGVLIKSYPQIDKLEEQVNYPPGTEGLYPKAQGTFSEAMIDGLRIYIPVMAVVG